MVQLANLASQSQVDMHDDNAHYRLRTSLFDPSTLIDEIEASIRSWNYSFPPEDAFADEESMQLERDCYHCCEAFRHGLLVYIHRVFRWKRGSKPPLRLSHLSRVALDHMYSCRPSTEIQKQVLFMVFLAAAETVDPTVRQRVLDYLVYWFDRYGYQMYATVSTMLRELWSEQDAGRGDDIWWGDVVDRMQRPGQQFCFG